MPAGDQLVDRLSHGVFGRMPEQAGEGGVAVDDPEIAIGDNDLWIAATASVKESVLVTCDRDHLRIARDLPVEVVYLQPPV